MKNIVLLALACCTLNASRAQDLPAETLKDTVTTYLLPEVVVTATRTERNPNDIGRSISVISSESLKFSLFQNVGEALAYSEGLYLVGAGQNLGANQSIFMRGSGSNQTTFMVDDVRITDPSGVNNALDLSELTTAGIERMEIVRGAHSTLYGSSAIGGVVNFITPKNSRPGFNADAELRTGAFGKGALLFHQRLFVNYTDVSGLYLNGEVLNVNVNGMDASIDTVTNPAAFNNRDRDGLSALDYVGKVGYSSKRIDAYVSFKRHKELKDIDKSAYTDDDNYTLDFKRNLLTYGASYGFNDAWSVKFIGGYSDMRREAVDDSSVIDKAGSTDQSYYEQRWNGALSTNELQANVRLQAFEALIGAGVYHETMSSMSYFFSDAFGPFELTTNLDPLGLNATITNVFAHADINGYLLHPSLDRFSLALGARLSDHNAFGRAVTYEINPAVHITDGSMAYLSFSTGFNAPSLYQLFAPDSYYTSNIPRGNKNLQPEESSSFELGLKHMFGTGARFTLSYYHTIVEHAIEFVYLWDKNVPIGDLGNDFLRDDYRGDTYLNVGKQMTDGFELTVVAPLSEKLSLSGNVSIVSGRLQYAPAEVDATVTEGNHVQLYNNGSFLTQNLESTELIRRPNTLNLAVTYLPVDAWTLRVDVRHAGSRLDVYYDSRRGPFGALGSVPVQEYTVVDLTQRYQFTEHFSISARLENILNTSYQEIKGFQTRGRGIFVNLRYAFTGAM